MKAFGILAFLLLFAWSTTGHAENESTGLRIQCDGGSRWGAGALVRDFRPDHEGGLLLLTALHVIVGCAAIEPTIVTCTSTGAAVLTSAWNAAHAVQGLAWKELDLAALAIPENERSLFESMLPFQLASRTELKIPERDKRIQILAKADLNVCPIIPANRRDLLTVKDLFLSRGEPDRYEALGSLTNETRLLSYESTASRGTSGGPVVWQPGVLLAIHVGGGERLQWGVPITRDDLLERKADVVALDAQHRIFDVPGYRQPRMLLETDSRTAAEIDLHLHQDELLAMVETTTPIDPFGAVAVSPQVGWSHLWFSPPFALLDTAIGSRVLLGGQFGRYRSPMTGPNYEEPPRDGTARLPFYGALLEIDAELHLARLAPVQYVASLGVRGGISHQRYVDSGANSFVWGPVLSGRVVLPLGSRLSGALQLHVTVQHIPVAATMMGCTGPSLERPSVWDAWGGVGMGVEMSP